MRAKNSTYPWKSRRLRLALYAVGILIVITVAGLARISPAHTPATHAKHRTPANLTNVNALTIAPITDHASNVGVPAAAISPTVTFTQPTQASVVTWAADGLPPGISISRSSGQMAGTPTTTGAFSVTVSASADAHPPIAASQSFYWIVDDTAPLVTRITPDTGAGGTRTVIAGKNFLRATSVHFGSAPATFTVNRRGTAIVARAPAERPGVVDVTVTYAGGTRSPVTADRFTYVAPTITAVSPQGGPISGGTRVRITGTALAGATSVHFGNALSKEFAVHDGGNVLTAVAPAGTAGTVPIVVVAPSGIVSTSGSFGFTYRAHA